MESNQNANEQVEHVEMHEDQNGACGISAANYSANGKISGILFPKGPYFNYVSTFLSIFDQLSTLVACLLSRVYLLGQRDLLTN